MRAQENTELMSLFASVLAHRAKAEPAANTGDNHVIAEHAGLTIHFHDAMPACDCCPPLSVSIYDDDASETVFMGNVDPDDLSDCFSAEWQRGDWENKLKHLH